MSYLAEEPGVEPRDVGRHDGLIHVVQLAELGPGRVPLLHQIQY